MKPYYTLFMQESGYYLTSDGEFTSWEKPKRFLTAASLCNFVGTKLEPIWENTYYDLQKCTIMENQNETEISIGTYDVVKRRCKIDKLVTN